MDSNILNWVDHTTAEVDINLYSLDYVKLELGSHRLRSVQIRIRHSPLASQHDRLLKDLLESVNSTAMKRLYLSVKNFPFGQKYLRKLVTPDLEDLTLEGVKIGRIINFDYNLTSFECNDCSILCSNCLNAPRLQNLTIKDKKGSMRIDLRQILKDNRSLKEFVVRTSPAKFSDLDLPFQENIENLELAETLSAVPYHKLNISGLVNLRRFAMAQFVIFSTTLAANFTISNLRKLEFLSFVQCNIYPVDSPFGDVLHIVNTRIGRSMNDLTDLLKPVSKTLEVLDLSRNPELISQLPNELLFGMTKLRSLDLSENRLVSLDGTVFSTTVMLSSIKVIANTISTFRSVEYLPKLDYLRELEITKNRLQCSCGNRKLRDWIRRHQEVIIIGSDQFCPTSTKTKFMDFSLDWIACDFHKEGVTIGSVMLLTAIMCAIAYAIYYYRFDIIFWWVVKRHHKTNRRHNIHPERTFHAFLSYSSSEQEIAEYIFFELEGGKDVQYKIAYDCRDFKPGYTIADNIIRCIDHSEKVIFLISQRFLEREWCEFELNFAQMRCFDERKNLIILIFVQRFRMKDLPKRLQILCRHVNYLEYPDHADKREVQNFWHRLRIALAEDSELETGENEPGDEHTYDEQRPLLT